MVDKPLIRSSHGPLCHPLGGSISLGLFHCRQATGEKGCHARTDSKSSSPKAGVNAEALQLSESGKAWGGKT